MRDPIHYIVILAALCFMTFWGISSFLRKGGWSRGLTVVVCLIGILVFCTMGAYGPRA